MTKRVWLTVAVLAVTLALSACDVRRGAIESDPGERSEDWDAAQTVLHAVADSVPLVTVRISTAVGVEERRTVGVVVGEHGRILVDAAVLARGDDAGEPAPAIGKRSIDAVFHPGGDDERRISAEVVRENPEIGMALLAMKEQAPPAVPLGDDVPDGAPAVLICIHSNIPRLVAEAGSVGEYTESASGRYLLHTGRHEPGATGPIFDATGALIGLQVSASPSDQTAVPAFEISRWLQRPAAVELSASEPGQVLGWLLREMDVPHRPDIGGEGYVLAMQSGANLRVRQSGSILSVEADLGSLHVGDAVEALRSNYSDPVGALVLKPAEGVDRLVWLARLPAAAADADYLRYVTDIAVVQTNRWRQIAAGLEPNYPYEYYPGGDEEALSRRLAEIVNQLRVPHEMSGEGHRLDPNADVPVYVTEFRGMAYVYAYSGGMPGDGEIAQEQNARELMRRNWKMRLGRFSLDQHNDLAWEAQAPVEYLTPEYLAGLMRVGQAEIRRIASDFGDIPFNEQ